MISPLYQIINKLLFINDLTDRAFAGCKIGIVNSVKFNYLDVVHYILGYLAVDADVLEVKLFNVAIKIRVKDFTEHAIFFGNPGFRSYFNEIATVFFVGINVNVYVFEGNEIEICADLKSGEPVSAGLTVAVAIDVFKIDI